MPGDDPSASAVDLTLGLSAFSRRRRKAKFAAGDRRRSFCRNNTAPAPAAIPAMPVRCACAAVLRHVPCGRNMYGLPYVVPCWAGPAGPDILRLNGKENNIAVAQGSNSSISNETKTEKLEESSLKNKKKEIKDKMPYVTAKGDGPEGKTITGFLYRYTKAEVSIMCVCHGRSFSPAEFLRHAGNSHTSQPLRQIVVVPSPARS